MQCIMTAAEKRLLFTVGALLLVILTCSQAEETPDDTPPTEDLQGTEPPITQDELEIFLTDNEDNSGNVTRDCGRPKSESLTCPDDDIIFYLYSGPNAIRERIDVNDPQWIKNSKFNPALPTVLLVHGYRGGDSLMPMVVAKDAYIKLGTHNMIMADWGILAKASCYPQAVGSLKSVAKCAGHLYNYLRETAGVKPSAITCVGHSLGSHVCGLLANYVPEKLDKIVALDPARPLLRRRRPNNRLDDKDAKVVQVIHTNAGFYGLSGRQGTVDFCVNTGRSQPFCKTAKNEQLCSHLEAVCFFAESLFRSHARVGEPCAARCPTRSLNRFRQISGHPVTMGAWMEDFAENGMYCVRAPEAPYCRDANAADPTYGDHRCCLRSSEENNTMDLSDPEWLNSTSIFNMDLPTAILVHGFSRINGIDILRNAYLRRGTHNVIVVDWVAIAQVHCYLQSVSSLKGVAKCTAHMMTYLEAAGVDPDNVTCVGHSLGAHVCGLLSNYRSEKLQNIVALDPARPLMQFRPPEDRLDSKDAAVVQVLHSSAGYYGMSGMVGTADFCLNNGLQPYCSLSVAMLLCSHLQAICFYAESLDPAKNITGTPCVQACPQINLPIPGNPVKLGIEMEESWATTTITMGAPPPAGVLVILCLTSVLLALLAARGGCQDPPLGPNLGDPTNSTGNLSRPCIIREEAADCSDSMIRFYLYAGPDPVAKEIKLLNTKWVSESKFNPDLPTVVFVHGYRGGDSIGPAVLLKDEYIRRAETNLITMDWGVYTKPPCYRQAVASSRSSAKCLAQLISTLEKQGVDEKNITCLGHNLGAHLCGQVSNFRTLHKIIALDPLRRFFRLAPNQNKLDAKDATVVQVIHTNAGYYGIHNRVGTADFCVNRGQQPYCSVTQNRELCSHWHAVCYMAESLDPNRARMATPCESSCPQADRNTTVKGDSTLMGQFMDDSASGMYCVNTETPPFCRTKEDDTYGDVRCCPVNRTRIALPMNVSGTGITMCARPPSSIILVSCLTGVILALLAAIYVFFVVECGGQDPPADLFLNDPANLTGNVSRSCISRSSNQPCPDPMLHFYLYAGPDAVAEEINVTDPEWFVNSTFDSNLPTVVLVHGYRGGDSIGPMVLLKNEYLRLGEHNLIMMDWGAYTRPPCYLQAIGSMRSSAKCLAQLLYAMEESGLDAENVTCVGHSLGLDPARPIFDISSDQDRLDRKDAKIVQIIHSNAGFYGMHNRIGTADFCINRGHQPFCTRTRNRELCSHVHALCFMAESLDPERARMATPCSPSCPLPNRNNTISGEPTFLGHFMNDSATGMYCVESETPPFCRTMENDTYGDIRC
ncbi:hypothetical protein B566_EDAN005327 [Ephemera danica]|nr:hypothetical protein B566_EDAN005327 [Ephemera danica]